MGKPTAAVLAEVQQYAASIGYAVTTRCRRCNAPLWNPKSLAAHLGPVCRAHEKSGAGSSRKRTTDAARSTNPNDKKEKVHRND